MKIYWTHSSIPELRQLSQSQRREAWKRGKRAAYRHWQTWSAWFAYVFSIYAGIVASNVVFGRFDRMTATNAREFLHAAAPRLSVLVLFAGVGLFILDQVIVAYARPYLASHRGDREGPAH